MSKKKSNDRRQRAQALLQGLGSGIDRLRQQLMEKAAGERSPSHQQVVDSPAVVLSVDDPRQMADENTRPSSQPPIIPLDADSVAQELPVDEAVGLEAVSQEPLAVQAAEVPAEQEIVAQDHLMEETSESVLSQTSVLSSEEIEEVDPVADVVGAPVMEEEEVVAISQAGPAFEEPVFEFSAPEDLEGSVPSTAVDSTVEEPIRAEVAPSLDSGDAEDPEEQERPLDNIDPSLLDVVLEEVQELMPAIELSMQGMAVGNKEAVADLLRQVHTLKGVVGMAGAMRARALIHKMESRMEDIKDGRRDPVVELLGLEKMFATVRELVSEIFQPQAEVPAVEAVTTQGTVAAPAPQPAVQHTLAAPKSVRVSAENMDRLFNETNEARLARASLEGTAQFMRNKVRELEENIERFSRMLREVEIQAETQIQSRRAQLAETQEEFDPLEFDRFTRLQELSRMLSEATGDVMDLQRDMGRCVSEQETLLAYQERAITEVQEGLHKTRLTPVDMINDRLQKVVLITGRELGKAVTFSLVGGRVELDRVLLEKLVAVLEHILRNSVAHGIELSAVRQASNKPALGTISVSVRQEAGRAQIDVEDDGAGLNVDRIRSKAIEKGLWPAAKPMDDQQAVDMVCRPGFSTAEAISQIAGRGVGMDVVRNEILALGGRFDMKSKPGAGLKVSIQLPTSVASASVMVVEAGGETWSVPIDLVDDVMMLRGAYLEEARQTHQMLHEGEVIPFASLEALFGVADNSEIKGNSSPVLLLREGVRRVAVETHKMRQVVEVPLRPLGPMWGRVPGIVGSTLLPDGRASFLVDPLRAPWESLDSVDGLVSPAEHARAPLILVVDDSITVRKATAKVLERHGFEYALAKDGQEALELLVSLRPAVMLLDVEMPRMDGFDCAKNVRESPRHRDLPIIMITSRTADKHRQRAMSLGVDAYLGKPFREDDLMEQVRHFVKNGRAEALPA